MAHVAQWKKDTVASLQDIIENNKTVAIVKVDKIPGLQLQSIRSELRDRLTFKVAKKTLIKLALENVKGSRPNIEKLEDNMEGQAAVLGTDLNPFSLFKLLGTKVQPMPAKGGEEAPEDIVVDKGETPFPPGPIVGDLGKVGIPAAIEKGKVVIRKKVTPVKKGETISRDLAQALTKLDIFPFEVGVTIDGAWEDGLLYKPSDLDIDMDAYKQNLTYGAQMAFNLAVFTAYMTPQTAVPLIQKARMQSLSLATHAGIINKDTADLVLSKAYGGMLALARLMSDDALDDDLRALVAGAAAAQTTAAAGEEPSSDEGDQPPEDEEEDEEEEASEEEAAAGLGALFG